MKWTVLFAMMLIGVCAFGQGSTGHPLRTVYAEHVIKKEVDIVPYQSLVPLTNYSAKGIHFYKTSETPFSINAPLAAFQTTGCQPLFCAFESKLYKGFKIPIKVRLDDRRYDFR